MKKTVIALIALLTVGITSAQSKKSLEKEFLSLEKKSDKISMNYEAQLQKLESNTSNDKLSEDDFGDMSGGFGDAGLGGNGSIKETMEMFIEMYEHNAKEGGNSYAGFLGDDKKQSKELQKITKEYQSKMKKIEKRMYEIAKKYLAKK